MRGHIRRRTRQPILGSGAASDPRRAAYPVVDAGAVASPAPASHVPRCAAPRMHTICYFRRARFVYTRPTMTTSTDIDLDQLIADTEAEILRLVADRDPSTHGLYEMVRYHLALDGSGASGGKRIRPLLGLLAYASIAGEHARALPGAAAVELGHNFSLVHDDIEDGDVERRHRPTLWTIHGIPQAINTGDTLFSLSRIALHRLSDLGFSDAKVLRLMRLFDETCLALCEGQYLDIAASALERADDRGRLLRHDRAQDRRAHRRLDRGRRPARYRRRGRHRPVSRLRLGARTRLPGQRRPARHLGRGAGHRQGSIGRRPSQADAPRHLRPRDGRPRGPGAAAGALRRAGPDAGGGRRGRGDPGADRRPRIHARAARRYRDEALAELDAAGVLGAAARARLEQIIVAVIDA